MKKISKLLTAFAIISFLVLPIFVSPVLAQTPDFGQSQVNDGLNGILPGGEGGNGTDPREIAGRIINFALGFLALIAVAIVLYGGFKWMTAAGNEDEVSEAKKLLGAGLVGLLILMAAWALSAFALNAVYNAVNGS